MCCSRAKTQQFGHHRRGDRAGGRSERLRRADEEGALWRRWGPSLSDRQCGTVRGDHSDNGEALCINWCRSQTEWRVGELPRRLRGASAKTADRGSFLLTFMRR